MKRLVFVLFLFVGHVATLRAEPFEQAEVTKAINLVSLLPQDTRAVPGDLVKGNTALQTGGNSRAELQFPDLTITRVGSNALFRFIAGTREIVLDSGTMLFSSPQGAGGGKVQAGAITRGGYWIGLSDLECRKGQGDLPKPQGHRLFHSESQDPSCATPRTDARYQPETTGRSENASRHDN